MIRLKPFAFVVLGLVLSIVIAGCLAPASSDSGVYDCGTSFSCLKERAVASCGPAKGLLSDQGVTVYSEVTAKDANCNIFVQLKDVQLGAEASEEARKTVEDARPLFPLATMTCLVTKSEVSALQLSDLISSQSLLDKCQGVLKDQIARLKPALVASATPAMQVQCVLPNANSKIVDGQCLLTSCKQGYADCDVLSQNGCEVDVFSNPANCGACSVACGAGQYCVAAKCIGQGETTPVLTVTPIAVPTATTTPTAMPSSVATGIACNNQAQCDDVNPCTVDRCDNGFCTHTNSVGTQCNDGTTCTSGDYCLNGGCVGTPITACASGDACCPAGCSSSTDTDCAATTASATECVVANGRGTLRNGACTIASCNPGFADCDGVPQDGCESNTNSDQSNCGRCAQVCRESEVCLQGVCRS